MLEKTFVKVFGSTSEFTTSAHGRVNLIGEHTDYNEGFVLPALIPQKTDVSIKRRHDSKVRACSLNFDQTINEFFIGEEKKRNHWIDYVQGLTTRLLKRDFQISGFELLIASNVPLGSGLSSSASFLVSTLRAIDHLFGLKLSAIEMAKIAQESENIFVGAHVGIMDQMAISLLNQSHTALFLDTKTLDHQMIPISHDVDLIVVNSGVSHQNANGDYNTRRAECEKACELLKIKSLREATLNQCQNLPEVLKRRARHVVTENARVLLAVDALKKSDFNELGKLFYFSHLSMKDDFEVSIPQIDRLVEIAKKHPSVFGARLTGGGFGGSIVVLAKRETNLNSQSTSKNIHDEIMEEYLETISI